jgi:UPF0755 protein
MTIRLNPLLAGLLAFVILGVGVVLAERAPSYAVGAPSFAAGGASQASNEPVTVEVRQGDTAASIGARLKAAGVIQSADLFTELTGLEGLQNGLAAGQYELNRGMPVSDVIARLHQGSTGAIRVTIPEGKRIAEVADILEKAGALPAQSFLDAVNNGHYSNDFLGDNPNGAGIEGYIFPDTYNLPQHNNASDVVNLMLKDFGERLTPDLRAAFRQQGLSIHDAVTLASIVEREAQQADERPTIASVFMNRIRAGMALQADPTVQFALSANPKSVAAFGLWKQELTLDDLTVDSPYNTYVKKGLPPGPIANPGIASMQAVAHPAQTKYLFFVAKNDGTHVFAETFAEHQANIAKYQH